MNKPANDFTLRCSDPACRPGWRAAAAVAVCLALLGAAACGGDGDQARRSPTAPTPTPPQPPAPPRDPEPPPLPPDPGRNVNPEECFRLAETRAPASGPELFSLTRLSIQVQNICSRAILLYGRYTTDDFDVAVVDVRGELLARGRHPALRIPPRSTVRIEFRVAWNRIPTDGDCPCTFGYRSWIGWA